MSEWQGRYALIIGPRSSGKTTTAIQVVLGLAHQGWAVGGVVQPVIIEGGQRIGYDLVAFGGCSDLCPTMALGSAGCLQNGRTVLTRGPFGRDLPEFHPQAWELAAEAIQAASTRAQILVVDELGWLESNGEGHLPALLSAASSSRNTFCLATTRADYAPAIVERIGAPKLRWTLPIAAQDIVCGLDAVLREEGARPRSLATVKPDVTVKPDSREANE